MLRLSTTYKKYLINTVLIGLGIIGLLSFLYFSLFYLFNYAPNSEKPLFIFLLGIVGIACIFVMEITSDYSKIKKVYEGSHSKNLKTILQDIDSSIVFIQSIIEDANEIKESLSNSELTLSEKQELAGGMISLYEANKNDIKDIKRGIERFTDIQIETINTLKEAKRKIIKGEGLSRFEFHILWENCTFDD